MGGFNAVDRCEQNGRASRGSVRRCAALLLAVGIIATACENKSTAQQNDEVAQRLGATRALSYSDEMVIPVLLRTISEADMSASSIVRLVNSAGSDLDKERKERDALKERKELVEHMHGHLQSIQDQGLATTLSAMVQLADRQQTILGALIDAATSNDEPARTAAAQQWNDTLVVQRQQACQWILAVDPTPTTVGATLPPSVDQFVNRNAHCAEEFGSAPTSSSA